MRVRIKVADGSPRGWHWMECNGERVGRYFAITPCCRYQGAWTLTHVPTGWAAADAWEKKPLRNMVPTLIEILGPRRLSSRSVAPLRRLPKSLRNRVHEVVGPK